MDSLLQENSCNWCGKLSIPILVRYGLYTVAFTCPYCFHNKEIASPEILVRVYNIMRKQLLEENYENCQ